MAEAICPILRALRKKKKEGEKIICKFRKLCSRNDKKKCEFRK